VLPWPVARHSCHRAPQCQRTNIDPTILPEQIYSLCGICCRAESSQERPFPGPRTLGRPRNRRSPVFGGPKVPCVRGHALGLEEPLKPSQIEGAIRYGSVRSKSACLLERSLRLERSALTKTAKTLVLLCSAFSIVQVASAAPHYSLLETQNVCSRLELLTAKAQSPLRPTPS
jgi:hypothetical protein